MTIAITREVSRSIGSCELTHLPRSPIDLGRARKQHAEYEEALASLGCRVLRLPEEPDLPDSVFVEDTALVLPELAIIARPGVESRWAETLSIAAALAEHHLVLQLQPPATLDGGDVLVIDRMIYLGASTRTNDEAERQMAELVASHEYEVRRVPVRGCLHLKSAATRVSADRVLVNPEWVDPAAFAGVLPLEIDPEEPFAANALWVGDGVIHASAFPHTRARMEQSGIRVVPVEADELAKAEGGVTCCSLVFD